MYLKLKKQICVAKYFITGILRSHKPCTLLNIDTRKWKKT